VVGRTLSRSRHKQAGALRVAGGYCRATAQRLYCVQLACALSPGAFYRRGITSNVKNAMLTKSYAVGNDLIQKTQ
jgi:hypothetical protein